MAVSVVIEEINHLLERAERLVDEHSLVARDLQSPTALSPAQLVIERAGSYGYYEIRARVRKRGVLGGAIMRGRSSEIVGAGDSPEKALERFQVNLEAWSGVLR